MGESAASTTRQLQVLSLSDEHRRDEILRSPFTGESGRDLCPHLSEIAPNGMVLLVRQRLHSSQLAMTVSSMRSMRPSCRELPPGPDPNCAIQSRDE
jgi:hypothetical protein